MQIIYCDLKELYSKGHFDNIIINCVPSSTIKWKIYAMKWKLDVKLIHSYKLTKKLKISKKWDIALYWNATIIITTTIKSARTTKNKQ